MDRLPAVIPECITAAEAQQSAEPQAQQGASQPGPTPPDEPAAGQTCPSCGATLTPDAVLCVTCGLNLKTGERVPGVGIPREAGGPPPLPPSGHQGGTAQSPPMAGDGSGGPPPLPERDGGAS